MSEPRSEKVPVTAEESVVVDWWAPEGELPTAVYVHGFGSHRRGEKALYFAEQFTARGWGYLTVDMRAHGEADGSMHTLTITGMLADLRAALDWVPHRPGPLVLLGSSMGGCVAGWHAHRHPEEVGGLVGLAPSFRFPRGMAEALGARGLQRWREEGVQRFRGDWVDLEVGYGLLEDAGRYDPETLSEAHRTPTLILHGMADESVPWAESLAFVDASPAEDLRLVLIKQGDHRLTGQKRFLFETAWAWWHARADEPG